MGRASDDVRVESVVTHRRRLRQAFLLGRIGQRRDVDDGVTSLIVAVVLAGVVCAGCVGFAFVRHAMSTPPAIPTTSTSTPPRTTGGSSTSVRPSVTPSKSSTNVKSSGSGQPPATVKPATAVTSGNSSTTTHPASTTPGGAGSGSKTGAT